MRAVDNKLIRPFCYQDIAIIVFSYLVGEVMDRGLGNLFLCNNGQGTITRNHKISITVNSNMSHVVLRGICKYPIRVLAGTPLPETKNFFISNTIRSHWRFYELVDVSSSINM